MYQFLLLCTLLLLTACTSTPAAPVSRDDNTKYKILTNQSEAVTAQNEYKKLQAFREKV